jgi:zinc transport system ATP-binding protein
MSENAVIEFENVSFAYTPGVDIIRDASFQIKQGESVSVIGPNGGGKSTILKLVLALIQPQKGRIRVLGKSPQEARMEIGYMPQYLNFDAKFPITVLDLVLMGRLGLAKLGPFRSNDKKKAREALDRVRMVDCENQLFSSLSGGQRQRVLIARALAADPKLLLLDEPTANVDQTIESQILQTLEELKKQMSILLVSHDLGFVYGNVEHALCVNRTVHMHPTTKLSGKTLEEVFGMQLAVVRHGESCPEGEHIHHHG